jgi:hypothetical protein
MRVNQGQEFVIGGYTHGTTASVGEGLSGERLKRRVWCCGAQPSRPFAPPLLQPCAMHGSFGVMPYEAWRLNALGSECEPMSRGAGMKSQRLYAAGTSKANTQNKARAGRGSFASWTAFAAAISAALVAGLVCERAPARRGQRTKRSSITRQSRQRERQRLRCDGVVT